MELPDNLKTPEAAVSLCKHLGYSDEEITVGIQKQFNLTAGAARQLVTGGASR